jgi:hypothetical protein
MSGAPSEPQLVPVRSASSMESNCVAKLAEPTSPITSLRLRPALPPDVVVWDSEMFSYAAGLVVGTDAYVLGWARVVEV